MTAHLPVPAAQYLRMSTEHQQYSTENQSRAISEYANAHGFTITCTYSDPAKSGLWLKNRPGLRQLLKDVTSGQTNYQAILVYDVSRWGRFQDADESAHYEFLCKSAGIPVHYCAEPFVNDGTMFSLIMKALKRAMAGEYSRELGDKVIAGQKHLARLGFKQGGSHAFGYRRMLVSSNGTQKMQLAFGERKSLASDRVVLVPGPDWEVEWVRRIFHMFTIERKSLRAIARELNSRHVPTSTGSVWDHTDVVRMIEHPRYIGSAVFYQHTGRLGSAPVRTQKKEWIVTPHAHQAIVDAATFAKAQEILQGMNIRKTDEQILQELKSVLTECGKLSPKIINKYSGLNVGLLRGRFGSIRSAYRLVGYGDGTVGDAPSIWILREDLLTRIQKIFPDEVSIVKDRNRRSLLKLKDGSSVAVFVANPTKRPKWFVKASENERGSLVLLARVGESRNTFKDFHVLPARAQTKCICLTDAWLKSGTRLSELPQFLRVAREMLTSASAGRGISAA